MTNFILKFKQTNFKGLFFSLLCMSMLGFASRANAVCYVNGAATGANDGSSWTDAYTNPQFALLKPDTCPEIWVAKGVYKPTLGADQTVSFVVLPAITIYGGFVGTETTRDQRVPAVNLTVLSGDVDSNDANAAGSQVDAEATDIHGTNSLHVVYLNGSNGTPITGSTVLDGFSITGGSATGTGLGGRGGGLFCNGNSNGRADNDANVSCSPTLRNLVFSGNSSSDSGGAIYNYAEEGGTSSPTLIDVTFIGNSAVNAGGAMYNNASDGGISSPKLTNVLFIANTSKFGGGMFSLAEGLRDDSGDGVVVGTSNADLANVAFIDNVAEMGGAVYGHGLNHGVTNPTLSVVTFSNNTATGDGNASGGAMYNYADGGETSPRLLNTTFSRNVADGYGGAIFNLGSNGSSKIAMINVTVNGNAASIGGGIFNRADAGGSVAGILTNVILWGDQASADSTTNELGESGLIAIGALRLDHVVLQGGCPADSTVICTNLLTGDPKLGPLMENGGFTRTLLPAFGSSAIDTGLDPAITPDTCPPIDQRGVSRPQGAHCEIGAVEVIPTPPPVAIPASVTTPINVAIPITLIGTDTNPGGPFTYSPTKPLHGGVTISGNIASYTPDTDFTGSDSFDYTVTDTNGTSAPATVSITVTSGPPVAKSLAIEIPHNTSASMKVSATDPNVGTFTFAFAVFKPTTHGMVSLSGDTALYTPTHNYTGPDEFTYTATDLNGTSLPATVTIQVDPAPPVADDKVVTTPYNTPKQITLSGSDNDNLGGPFALTFSLTSSPSHGTLGAISGSIVTYTPNHNYSGPDSFTYDTTDVNGESKPALVQITVLPPGTAPPPPSTTTAIPTLSTWGLLALAGLIGLTTIGRKRKV